MEFIMWSVNFALKILGICMGVAVFVYIVRNGPAAVKELVRLVGLVIKAGVLWLEKKIHNHDEKPAEQKETEQNLNSSAEELSLEEFLRKAKNKEPLILD